MAKLPERADKVAAAIYARIERDAEDWRRQHLGASIIGTECSRALWYSFRWASPPGFDGRMLRLFERGQREEDWIVEELTAIGWEVKATDDDGKQWRFEELGGHFGGSIDGAVLGVLGASKTWHLLEVKTSNERRFRTLQKEGVEKSNPQHFAQMQIYMHALKLTRALYVCVCKNDDQIYTERIKYDKEVALAILHKAEQVIFAKEPLSKISEDPSWFQCKFCNHHPVCQLGKPEGLERNCRTCLSSTPLSDGIWHCEEWDIPLDLEHQKQGCGQHLFIPALLPWKVIGFDKEERSVTYVGETANIVDAGMNLTLRGS